MSPEFVERYRRRMARRPGQAAPVDEVRFVVLDSETTGLDPRKDRLITIGAVGVQAGELLLDDVFEAMIPVEFNTASVTVHGITREASAAGEPEPLVLEKFLDYLGAGVIVGHHIGHDVETLNAGYERHWGFRLENTALDTMDLTLHLERDGGFAGRDTAGGFTLDALCALFGVTPHDRHTASGDAFMTALVFQRLLKIAARCGRGTLGQVAEVFPVE